MYYHSEEEIKSFQNRAQRILQNVYDEIKLAKFLFSDSSSSSSSNKGGMQFHSYVRNKLMLSSFNTFEYELPMFLLRKSGKLSDSLPIDYFPFGDEILELFYTYEYFRDIFSSSSSLYLSIKGERWLNWLYILMSNVRKRCFFNNRMPRTLYKLYDGGNRGDIETIENGYSLYHRTFQWKILTKTKEEREEEASGGQYTKDSALVAIVVNTEESKEDEGEVSFVHVYLVRLPRSSKITDYNPFITSNDEEKRFIQRVNEEVLNLEGIDTGVDSNIVYIHDYSEVMDIHEFIVTMISTETLSKPFDNVDFERIHENFVKPFFSDRNLTTGAEEQGEEEKEEEEEVIKSESDFLKRSRYFPLLAMLYSSTCLFDFSIYALNENEFTYKSEKTFGSTGIRASKEIKYIGIPRYSPYISLEKKKDLSVEILKQQINLTLV
jgi:hypothetical protein